MTDHNVQDSAAATERGQHFFQTGLTLPPRPELSINMIDYYLHCAGQCDSCRKRTTFLDRTHTSTPPEQD